MDRQTVYPAAIPLDTDILTLQRNAMVALGYALQACLGTTTVADGLACTPNSPANMTVNVGQGSIIALETIDATAWGSLAADTNPLVKIGINAEGTTPFTLTAPTISGDSINYLIEASFLESDATPLVLPYYNASNPAQPYSGPGNSGTSQNTQRTQRVQLQLKAGTQAPTGTQTTPALDAGWVGLWIVTVNYGQTQITSAAISEHSSAPFIPAKLGPGMWPGFTREVWFTTVGAWSWTPPPGVTKARIHLQAGGSGGGGTSATNGAAGGGSGGSYGRVVVTVTPGTAISGIVGSGGAGGTGSGNGTQGGSTTCTAYSLTAYAGAPGNGTSTGTAGVGGNTATPTGAFDYVNAAGGGGNGQIYGTTGFGGGQGGAPGDGRGGAGQVNIGSAGIPGAWPGQGGNGGSGSGSAGNTGGAGAAGYVRIEY